MATTRGEENGEKIGERTVIEEKRQVFEFEEMRLSYTCSTCKTEFNFDAVKHSNEFDWRECPRCHVDLEKVIRDGSDGAPFPDLLLWNTISAYRDLQKSVRERALPLRLCHSKSSLAKAE
jgi:DNA-directed RNA polymerase subunit RPC12/RpoP